jgi:hypothetical protein
MKTEPAAPIPISNERTYWGVSCRTCGDLVAFDIGPCPAFGLGSRILKPGAIRCVQGHNHIYFPRDFRFFPSEIAIAEVTMQANRTAYIAINPPLEPSSDLSVRMEH